MDNITVLLIDGNIMQLEQNTSAFIGKGFDVYSAKTIPQANTVIEMQPNIDIIVLADNISDADIINFTENVKQEFFCPVIIISEKNSYEDIVQAVSSDADLYITTPYSMEAFIASAEGLVKKYRKSNISQHIKDELILDIVSGHVKIDVSDLRLTPKELSLLLILASHEEGLIPQELLYEKVWRQPLGSDKSALRMAITRLRKKLEGSGFTIISSRNKGYSLEKE